MSYTKEELLSMLADAERLWEHLDSATKGLRPVVYNLPLDRILANAEKIYRPGEDAGRPFWAIVGPDNGEGIPMAALVGNGPNAENNAKALVDSLFYAQSMLLDYIRRMKNYIDPLHVLKESNVQLASKEDGEE